MTQTATLLLLFAGEPTQSERQLLGAYAKKQRVELVAPAPTPASPYPTYRTEVVQDLEGRLDEARTLASSLDEERALALLAAVERDVVQHPELPQAAWLLAEHHRALAELRRGEADGAAEALELARAADALEGPRTATFGEAGEAPAALEAPFAVRFTDLGPRDVLELDGAAGGAERSLPGGQHHARVLRGTELVWAGWVLTEPSGGRAEVRLGVRPVAPCAAEDFPVVEKRGAAPGVAAGTLCPHWVAVRRALGALELAECVGAQCGRFVTLRPSAPERSGGFPTWATVTLASVGAVGATALVLWAGGAFDRDQPPGQTVFRYEGLR